MTMGTRIKEARTEAGVSQADLAARLGITQSAIGQWEQDKTQPKVELICTLAKELRVSLEWLLGADTSPISVQTKNNGIELVSQLSYALANDQLLNGQIRVISDILNQFLVQVRNAPS